MNDDQPISATGNYINMTLLYLFRKRLLKNSRASTVLRSLERLVSRLDLGAMGIRTSLLVLDRHSPLSCAIAKHVHWDLALQHRGAETCARLSLENVHIIQGAVS